MLRLAVMQCSHEALMALSMTNRRVNAVTREWLNPNPSIHWSNEERNKTRASQLVAVLNSRAVLKNLARPLVDQLFRTRLTLVNGLSIDRLSLVKEDVLTFVRDSRFHGWRVKCHDLTIGLPSWSSEGAVNLIGTILPRFKGVRILTIQGRWTGYSDLRIAIDCCPDLIELSFPALQYCTTEVAHPTIRKLTFGLSQIPRFSMGDFLTHFPNLVELELAFTFAQQDPIVHRLKRITKRMEEIAEYGRGLQALTIAIEPLNSFSAQEALEIQQPFKTLLELTTLQRLAIIGVNVITVEELLAYVNASPTLRELQVPLSTPSDELKHACSMRGIRLLV